MRNFFQIVMVMWCLTVLAGCAGGRSAFSKAQRLEEEGKYDEAVLKYAEASSQEPTISEYRLRLLKVSEKAAKVHFDRGERYFADNRFDEALREYQAALELNPSISRAKQQSDNLIKQRTALVYFREGEDFERNNKPREALGAYRKSLNFNTNNLDTKDAIERLLKNKQSKMEMYELNLKSNKPITLKFKDAKIKDVFYILSQLSGINFIFDEGVKDQNVTIFLENASFNQALDILSGMNKLGKKVLNESTVIVFPRTPDKQKQYEELVIKTIYLNTLDAKKAVNLLRTMLQIRKIYVNEELNAVVIRDSPEVIEVAQKILEANDVPEAEVLLDVEVIEISKNNVENFGLGLSRYSISTIAATPSGKFLSDKIDLTTSTLASGSTSVSAIDTSNMLDVLRWRGFTGFLTVPNATYNFGKTISNAEVLANPKIRVRNKEKSKFNVGTRVPITTTSSTGTTGGVNVNVQYVDVGVKVNAEPVIQLNNEVSIKLGVEVSSILSRDKVGADQATTVVTIGTRNLDTVLNLKDGETSVIGGLIQDNKSKSKEKPFLLGDIPGLGGLLSNNSESKNKTELVLAITPRIVRALTVPDPDVAAFWSGKEDEPSVSKIYASFEDPETDAQSAKAAAKTPAAAPPQAAPVIKPAAPSAPTPQPAPQAQQVIPQAQTVAAPAVAAATEPLKSLPPATTQTQAAPATTGVPAAVTTKQPATVTGAVSVQPVTPTPQPATPAPEPKPVPVPQSGAPVPIPASSPRIASRGFLNIMAPSSVTAGQQFTVEVKASDMSSLYNAPFMLVYDPIFLEFVSAFEGEFLRQGGAKTTFNATVDKNGGLVTVLLGRVEASGGVSGSGSLFRAIFKAKASGPAGLGFRTVKFSDHTGKNLDVVPYNTVIEVK